jgi:hypothetical protein
MEGVFKEFEAFLYYLQIHGSFYINGGRFERFLGFLNPFSKDVEAFV